MLSRWRYILSFVHQSWSHWMHGMRDMQVARMKEEVPLPAPPADHPPAFVLGAEHDMLVDLPAIEETAALYGVAPVILKHAAHDVMLVSGMAYHDYWAFLQWCMLM